MGTSNADANGDANASTSATSAFASARQSGAFGDSRAAKSRQSSAVLIEERSRLEQSWPWVLRVLWLLMPFTVGALLSGGFSTSTSSSSSSARLAVLIVAWAWWAVVLMATLVPHPVGLVAVRLASFPVVGATAWGLVGGDSSTTDVPLSTQIAALVLTIVFIAVALHAETGHWCVNGPAYANERRFLLRSPALVQLLLMPLAAALVAASTVVAPVFLAQKKYVPGAGLTLLGTAIVIVCSRALYAQTKRFLVFVPAGLVVHDYETLREPVLFQSRFVEGVRLAPEDTDSLDLTATAAGSPVEVLLHEKLEITRVKNSRDRVGDTGKTARFLVTPTLPGRFVQLAAKLGLPR